MNYNKENAEAKKDSINSPKNKKKKKRTAAVLKIILILLLVTVIAGLCVGFAFVKELIDSSPSVSDINLVPSNFATIVYYDDGEESTRLVQSGSNRQYVKISEMPDCILKAFVAIEDERFYEHRGIDIPGIIRAFFVGITNMNFSEGASTITQQLIKNNVFTSWTEEVTFIDSLRRKIQEQYLAIQVEKVYSKDEILEYYLNSINLGQNCLGVQTAAMRYFDKDVSELNISEAAVIAAITQNPTNNNPITNPENNKKRRDIVLANMLKFNYITQDEYNSAMEDNVYSRVLVNSPITTSLSTTSSFIDELILQAVDALCEEKGYTETQAYNLIYSGGLKIYSTQNKKLQQVCDEEANKDENYDSFVKYSLSYRVSVTKPNGNVSTYTNSDLKKYIEDQGRTYPSKYDSIEAIEADLAEYKEYLTKDGSKIIDNSELIYYVLQPQTSITLADQSTGEVKALVGGRGEKVGDMTLNRATQITRQPGSCFKVLAAFAPAIDTCGKTLATVYQDVPYSYPNGVKVNNWWGDSYRGYKSIREGIYLSMNIVAIKCITDITPQVGFDYLKNFGFTTLVDHKTLDDGTVISDIGLPTALGGISLGVTNFELNAAYAAIANGGVYTKPIMFTKILDSKDNVIIDNVPSTKRVLKETNSYLLTNAMEDTFTVRGLYPWAKLSTSDCSGKSGTTNDNKDYWLVGYTPYYTCSVWGGYDVSDTLPSSGFVAKIWYGIMERIHKELPVKKFVVPEGIVKAKVCTLCGKLATEGLCDKDPRGSQVVEEFFAKDNVPTETCSCHVAVDVCKETNSLANGHCPVTEKKVFQILPEDGSKGSDDDPYLLPDNFMDSPCKVHKSASSSSATKPSESSANTTPSSAH